MTKTITKNHEILKLPDLSPEDAWRKDTKYEPEMNSQMMRMFSLGRTEAQIAASLGITTRTLHDWGKRYEDVGFILDMGRTKSLAYWQGVIQKVALKEIDADFNALKMSVKSQFRDDFVVSDSAGHGTTVNVNNNTLNLTDEQAQKRLQYLIEKKKAELE